MKAKPIFALSISLLLVFVLLSSSFFVIAEADHECSGEDCPVCHFLATVEDLFQKLALVFCAAAALFSLTASVEHLQLFFGATLPKRDPVSLKVKLSN